MVGSAAWPKVRRRAGKILAPKTWRKWAHRLLFWLARRTVIPAASALPRELRREIKPLTKPGRAVAAQPPTTTVPIQLIEDALLTLALHGRGLEPKPRPTSRDAVSAKTDSDGAIEPA